MVSSDFRAEARKKLTGKWGKVAVITLIYMAVFYAFSLIEIHVPDGLSYVISIARTVITIPLAFGLVIAFVKIFNGEEVGAGDFFSLGFNNFGKSWGIFFNILVKIIIPLILMIVSYVLIIVGTFGAAGASYVSSSSVAGGFGATAIIGVILLFVSAIWLTLKSYYYQLAYIVAAEHDELSSKQAVEKSKELMTAKRWKLFCLQFSFIGWAILAVFTLGIGMLWLTPYMEFATIAFYKNALGNNTEKVDFYEEKK